MSELTCVVCSKVFQHRSPQTLTCSRECFKQRMLIKTGRMAWQKELSNSTVGAISEMVIAFDLMKKGYATFRSLSPASICDLVAIKDNKILRIEVRTGYTNDLDGNIQYPKKLHGTIDFYGVYVPRLDKIAYFDIESRKTEL